MDGVDDPAKANEISDYYLLDVRPPADYAAGHISGAVNVPSYRAEQAKRQKDKDL